jgi:EpsI family protein
MKPLSPLIYVLMFSLLSAATLGVATYSRDRLASIPQIQGTKAIDIPHRIGPWTSISPPADIVEPWVNDGGDLAAQEIYDHLLTRGYRRRDGTTVTLVIAYKRKLFQEDRIHRPEVCYYAQGYQRSQASTGTLALSDRRIAVTGFLATGFSRSEKVLYWIRTGDLVSENAVLQRFELLKATMNGRIPDGALVRVSMPVDESRPRAEQADADIALSMFLKDLLNAVSEQTRTVLL